MKKDSSGFINLSSAADPAISRALAAGEQRQADQRLPKAERARLARERKKAAARVGRRAVYDLSPELISSVQALASEHSTTASQVAGLAIQLLLDGIERGEINLADYLMINTNPKSHRYERTVKSTKPPSRGTPQ